jgi:cardiolipin synthase
MLHAKAIVVDDRYALVGSANLDLRSLYLNFELMTLLYNREDVRAVRAWADTHLVRTGIWHPPAHSALRDTLEGLAMLLAFQL